MALCVCNRRISDPKINKRNLELIREDKETILVYRTIMTIRNTDCNVQFFQPSIRPDDSHHSYHGHTYSCWWSKNQIWHSFCLTFSRWEILILQLLSPLTPTLDENNVEIDFDALYEVGWLSGLESKFHLYLIIDRYCNCVWNFRMAAKMRRTLIWRLMDQF